MTGPDGHTAALFELLRSLWDLPATAALGSLLPRDPESLASYYPRLQEFVSAAPRSNAGTIDPAAIIRGEIVSMDEGSVIEAGAIIHESCRLILGPRSRVRSGAVLREEVIVGADCLIGAYCEVARSVILGPRTYLGHLICLVDSILGSNVSVAGNVVVANSTVTKKGPIQLNYCGSKINSGRSHLGVLVGDHVRFGASTTICPGCVVAPGLTLPPHVVLHGTIDLVRRRALMKQFFETWVEDSSALTEGSQA